jgi:hypothetical protein
MPLLFSFEASFSTTECDYAWSFDSNGFLCIAKSPGEQFNLIQINSDKYGPNTYAIQSLSNRNYLFAQNGGTVTASAESIDDATLFVAEPVEESGTPFLWQVASTEHYLHIHTDKENLILADGKVANDPDCHFSIVGSAAWMIV